MRAPLAEARRVVVKVGTAVVTRPDGGVALGRLGALVEQIVALRRAGREILLVSSGAIGLGAERLGFAHRPTSLVDRQACAAAGQGALMGLYDAFFGRLGVRCAQVLLTEADFHQRRAYVNLAATLDRLVGLGALPIINENDTVSTEELAIRPGQVFGDNDRLSALVASGLGCDALVLLSDVDGVYSADPDQPGARRIEVYDGAPVRYGPSSSGGTGGMEAKVEAARVAARAGVTALIASGSGDALIRALAGEDVGTLFPAEAGLSPRRRWLAFAAAPTGALVVNDGAREALVKRQASLLQPGIVEVVGTFTPGAVVSLICAGEEFGRGLCPRSAAEVRAGSATGKAVVHRDNLVILVEEA